MSRHTRSTIVLLVGCAVLAFAWWASSPRDEELFGPAGATQENERPAGVPADPAPAVTHAPPSLSGASQRLDDERRAPGPSGQTAPSERAARPATPSAASESSAAGATSGESKHPEESDANRQAIMTAMQQLVPALTNCFEQGLKLKPDFGGGFTLDFTLSPAADGGARAREGEVADSTLNSPLVEACILSAVRDADFTSVQVSGHLQVRLPLKAEGSRLGFGGTE